MSKEKENAVRMTEAAYAILLASYEPLHGYGIMQRVKELSKEQIIIGPGTLYGVLKKLIQQEWMTMHTVEGQKIYTTTTLGQTMVAQEVERLRLLIEMEKGVR